MKQISFTFLLMFIFSCSGNRQSEQAIYMGKVEAFTLLEELHHDLHVMIGEDHGHTFDEHEHMSPGAAFEKFRKAIFATTNPEIIPIREACNRVAEIPASPDNNGYNKFMLIDALVDMYQVGLQLQIEGILRGHGCYYPDTSSKLMQTYYSCISNAEE